MTSIAQRRFCAQCQSKRTNKRISDSHSWRRYGQFMASDGNV